MTDGKQRHECYEYLGASIIGGCTEMYPPARSQMIKPVTAYLWSRAGSIDMVNSYGRCVVWSLFLLLIFSLLCEPGVFLFALVNGHSKLQDSSFVEGRS